MIINKTVKLIPKTLTNYYRNLGYIIDNNYQEIEVKVENLKTGSGIKLQVKCDICGNEKILS